MRLPLVPGAMLREQLRETNRFVAEFSANQFLAAGRLVTLVEKQIERLQDAIEAPRQLVTRWNLKWHVCFLDFLFGTRQALGNRRFARQECAADFRHAETAECF